MGWVWLLRLVCTVETRFMGSIELGQVGWGGLSMNNSAAALLRRGRGVALHVDYPSGPH